MKYQQPIMPACRTVCFFLLPLLALAISAMATEAPTPPPSSSTSSGHLTLRDAQETALKENPGIRAALARVEQARARLREASAGWWPELDLSGSGTETRLSEQAWEAARTVTRLSGGEPERTTDTFTGGLQASWLLFDGFYRKFNELQARYQLGSTAAARLDSQRLLLLAVAESFFNAQLAQTKVEIAAADKAFYEKRLEDARSRYQVGAGSWGDVLNIRVQVNSAKTALLLNRRELEAASYGLAALMGIQEARLPDSLALAPLDQAVDLDSMEEDVEELIRTALALRPDVQGLELQVRAADAGREMARSAFYPRLFVSGSVYGNREDDPWLAGDDFGTSLGVNLGWNLFRGGADRARVFAAEQRKREASWNLVNLRNQVAAEIRRHLALLAAAKEQVRLQRESVELVKQNRDLAQSEYEAGAASLVRLNEAQRDLTATHGRLAQALVAYHLAKQRLQSATGRNLQQFLPPDELSSIGKEQKDQEQRN